ADGRARVAQRAHAGGVRARYGGLAGRLRLAADGRQPLPAPMGGAMSGPGFWRELAVHWLATLRALSRDAGILLILVGAPVLYGCFYPWPYAHQAVTRVPVAVVDLDRSGLSRQITRFASASPRIDVRWVGGNEEDARQALWRGEIEGYAVLPRELKRSVVRGTPAVVGVQANGSYALINKAVLYGFAEAVGTVSAGVEIRKLQARGQSTSQAMASRSPVNLQMVPLFNPTEGYGDY